MSGLTICEPVVKLEYNRLCDIKGVILKYLESAECGIFFCRNFAGDPMNNIYDVDDIQIDICYSYEYFEVFGLTKEEEKELKKFYYSQVKCLRKERENRYDRRND